ncbi:MAG: hypothetical protein AAF798_14080 [Bacteroidota bacterium]
MSTSLDSTTGSFLTLKQSAINNEIRNMQRKHFYETVKYFSVRATLEKQAGTYQYTIEPANRDKQFFPDPRQDDGTYALLKGVHGKGGFYFDGQFDTAIEFIAGEPKKAFLKLDFKRLAFQYHDQETPFNLNGTNCWIKLDLSQQLVRVGKRMRYGKEEVFCGSHILAKTLLNNQLKPFVRDEFRVSCIAADLTLEKLHDCFISLQLQTLPRTLEDRVNIGQLLIEAIRAYLRFLSLNRNPFVLTCSVLGANDDKGYQDTPWADVPTSLIPIDFDFQTSGGQGDDNALSLLFSSELGQEQGGTVGHELAITRNNDGVVAYGIQALWEEVFMRKLYGPLRERIGHIVKGEFSYEDKNFNMDQSSTSDRLKLHSTIADYSEHIWGIKKKHYKNNFSAEVSKNAAIVFSGSVDIYYDGPASANEFNLIFSWDAKLHLAHEGATLNVMVDKDINVTLEKYDEGWWDGHKDLIGKLSGSITNAYDSVHFAASNGILLPGGTTFVYSNLRLDEQNRLSVDLKIQSF